MPRTVDQTRYAERRDLILDAAYRQFALDGFDRTTTAGICRTAGISSGTFFHYFPTKLDALVGVLRAGVDATIALLRSIDDRDRGLDAALGYVTALESDLADPHFSGFARAVAGVEGLPGVGEALREETAAITQFLERTLGAAAGDHTVRVDVSVPQLATWTRWLLDGAAQQAIEAPVGRGELVAAARALLLGRPE